MLLRRENPGAVILGSDFKALAVVRSLGRKGIPSVVIDSVPRSAWYSRYVKERLAWHGAMEGEPFLGFLLGVGKLYGLERLLGCLGVSGMVEVEFKHDKRDDLYKLLDIDIRPWGWHSLCMCCSGAPT